MRIPFYSNVSPKNIEAHEFLQSLVKLLPELAKVGGQLSI